MEENFELFTDTGAPGGFSWSSLLDQAPTLVRDLYVAKQTGDYQTRLLEINLERARRGQAPLDMSQYAPQMNVGVAPQTQKAFGFSLAGIALAVGGFYLLTRRSSRR